MKRYHTLAALAAIALPVAASAQGVDALSFTRIDRSPVSMSLAGAGVASSKDVAWSAFGNSSVLPFYEGSFAADVSYTLWAPGSSSVKGINVGAAYKLDSGFSVTLGFAHDASLPYDVLDYDGVVTGSFTPRDNVVGLGLAFAMGEKFSAGVNVRYATEKLSSDYSNGGVAGDVFLTFQPSEALRFSAGLSNLGTSIQSYDHKKYSQPVSIVVAGAYSLEIGQDYALDIYADGAYWLSKNVTVAVGGQFSWKDFVFARAGYHYATANAVVPSFLGIGAGVKFAGISVDLSYLTASAAIGNTFAIGLGFSF